ncbi:MAG: nitrilase-related carbon-nitrogen hydrolase [Segniliparus sp.]|uniref:nitrilase-related carbon-nitrogen hydrolase n=1 Tax=Segniliparus sp. TaxID=2804064 RepID=UPI003F384E80
MILAVCQIAPRVGELAENRALAAETVRLAADGGADLVVLPELATSGYVFADEAEARSCAEQADGPSLREWQALTARLGLVLVAGFCESGQDGRLYNSAALVDRGEVRAVYRKAHLWDREKLVFAAGSARPPVVDTEHARVSMMICYDLEFPEWPRAAALAGADVLVVPTNWPVTGAPAGERSIEVVKVQASAAYNRIFVAAADRHAVERGVTWIGGSVIVNPEGFPVAGPIEADEDGILFAEIDVARARDKTVTPHNHAFDDMRSELYAP